jgi:hypothetical protein
MLVSLSIIILFSQNCEFSLQMKFGTFFFIKLISNCTTGSYFHICYTVSHNDGFVQ